MDETAAALWWGYNMMERFRDYPWIRPFLVFVPGADWVLYGPKEVALHTHQPSDDEVHVVWNSGNQGRNRRYRWSYLIIER